MFVTGKSPSSTSSFAYSKHSVMLPICPGPGSISSVDKDLMLKASYVRLTQSLSGVDAVFGKNGIACCEINIGAGFQITIDWTCKSLAILNFTLLYILF